MRPPALAEQALRRRWRAVLLAGLVAGVPLSVAGSALPEQTYRVTQGYLVTRDAPGAPAVVTANTDRAARDYASVLREDEQLLEDVARRSGTSAAHVRERLLTGYLPGAGTLFVRYEAADRAEVLHVLAELDRAFSATTASAPRAVPLDATAVETIPNRLNPFPAAGLLVALLAAAAAAVLAERLRPRLTTPAEVRAVTSLPLLQVDAEADVALVVRRALRCQPAEVVVLAAPGEEESAAAFCELFDRVREQLAQAGDLPEDAARVPVRLLQDDEEVGSRTSAVHVCALPLQPGSLPPAADCPVAADEVLVVVRAELLRSRLPQDVSA